MKHQQDMAHYQNEFAKTQQEVKAKSRQSASLLAPIIVFVVLLVIMAGSIVFATNAWSISYDLREKKVQQQIDQHRANLDALLEEGKYPEVSGYFHANGLYMIDGLDEYYGVYQAASNYKYLLDYFYDLAGLAERYHSETEAWYLRSCGDLAEYLQRLYDIEDEYAYDADRYFTEESLEYIADMRHQVEVLLKAYLGVTDEQLEVIPTASTSKIKAILIEVMEAKEANKPSEDESMADDMIEDLTEGFPEVNSEATEEESGL
ncbi:MAG: hypothetical protein KBS83_08565 [Lachnospiraceae bacterium]|nr:hypothetical protein [Candidatus Equihabitans merdae]